ncbi:hypothetical protein [Kitasatospora sp. NPDC086791]|uniref:hypothetical protein n=1 Tax=Kitasatospora sp. NPDC086791 TaxID=3155178 RepID=UPI0034230C06
MFDRLEIRILPPGPRTAAEPRVRANGEDPVAEAADPWWHAADRDRTAGAVTADGAAPER